MSNERPDWMKPVQYNNDDLWGARKPAQPASQPKRRRREERDRDIPRPDIRDPYPLDYSRGPHDNELDCDDNDPPSDDLYTETIEGPDHGPEVK